jgi:Ca2+-binding RTX toxin-like protein
MPNGYLVTLGDSSLDTNDFIDATQIFFTIASTIGTGGWNWTGVWAGNGSTYSNINDTGTYYEATDGNVYFIPDTWFTTSGTAFVTSGPAYTAPVVVTGTSGADVIDASYTDPNGDQIDAGDGTGPLGNEDTVSAGDGNDSVEAGLENDIVFGGGGDDTLEGGDGNDTLYGDTDNISPGGVAGDDSILGGAGNDVIFGEDGADTIRGNGGGDTIFGGGGADTIRGDGGGDLIDGGDGADTIAGDGGADTIRGGEGADSIDGNAGNDLIGAEPVDDSTTLDWSALDENGNQVPVVFSDLDGLHSVSGDDLNADGNASTGVETSGADDSVTVDIAGPFVQLIFTFDNGESATNSGLFGVGNMTLDFTSNYNAEPDDDTINGGTGNDTIFAGRGNDSISGGTGSDSLDGQDGDDFINVGEGDTAVGGDGDDTFQLVELGETVGAGAGIFVRGDEGGETTGDVLNLGTLGNRNDIIYSNTNDALGGLSGTLVLDDGTLLTFENIEKIICFTPGTMIDTPFGTRAVETLKAGDLVMTRDAGAQPLKWVGARTMPCTPDTAPILFEDGALEGQTAPLMVSPQHKMLISHFAAELLFGQDEVFCSAKHMLGPKVKRIARKMVTYVHIMFETHQVITANGVETESFHAGPEGMKALSDTSKQDLFKALPALKTDPYAHGRTAYPCLKSHETTLLMEEIAMAEQWRATQQNAA